MAKSHSLLSIGLSCFKLQGVQQTTVIKDSPTDVAQSDTAGEGLGSVKQWAFSVQTFNVVLLCSEDYLVEPASLKFLVEHGFDFNKQYSSGVTYHRGKEKVRINWEGGSGVR